MSWPAPNFATNIHIRIINVFAGMRIWGCVDQAKHHLPVISHVSHSAWISLKYPFFYLELCIHGANGDSSYDRKRTLPVKFGFIVRSDHHDSPMWSLGNQHHFVQNHYLQQGCWWCWQRDIKGKGGKCIIDILKISRSTNWTIRILALVKIFGN